MVLVVPRSRLKRKLEADLEIGWPGLSGGGRRTLPDGPRLELELIDKRRFESGGFYLAYSVTPTRDD